MNKYYDPVYYRKHSKAHCKRTRRYYAKHRLEIRDRYLKRRYGISSKEYTRLIKKSCQICNKYAKIMFVDHSHLIKGNYRGVLCPGCNSRLGWYEKWTLQIEKYLSQSL